MRISSILVVLLLLVPSIALADALVVRGCGPSVASRVAELRWLLGEPVNGTLAGQQPAGRREINWDGVAAAVTNTNTFPAGFFNTTSTRGLVMTSGGTGLRVSDNNFADVNASYSGQFGVFSAAKSFAVVGGNTVDVTFQLAGTTTPARVNGFGVVFSDVDTEGSTRIEFFAGADQYGTVSAPVRCDAGGLSFAGIVWNGSERITRVRITSGTGSLSGTANDVTNGGSSDLVVMDDFLYGEPSPLGQVLTASLSGAEEVPAGDPDGTGFATVTFDTAASTLRFSMVVQNIDAPTAAHIHTGAEGVAGPILINFAPAFTNGIASGTAQMDAATLQSVLDNASAFYVNVHTAAFPNGAVRGQLSYNDVNATRLVFPVVGRVSGAGGTEYRADVRLLNLSGLAHDVLAEYYAAGNTANTGPTATARVTVGAGEQELLDNVAKTLFNGRTARDLSAAAVRHGTHL
jgi:CHRD domain-containing protein